MAYPALYPTFANDVPSLLCVYASAPDSCVWVCDSAAVYRPRDPRASDFHACVEDNFEELERVYDERYAKQHGFWQMVELLLSWHHPGFSIYQGQSVQPEDTAARERLARYILHAPFSQERFTYDRSTRTVVCESKKNKRNSQDTPDGVTVFPALDWLAALVTHLPDKGQQLLRFYGRYSNVCQGRKKRQAGRAVQPVDKQAQGEDDSFREQCRSNWARLIKKILESVINCTRLSRCGHLVSHYPSLPPTAWRRVRSD